MSVFSGLVARLCSLRPGCLLSFTLRPDRAVPFNAWRKGRGQTRGTGSGPPEVRPWAWVLLLRVQSCDVGSGSGAPPAGAAGAAAEGRAPRVGVRRGPSGPGPGEGAADPEAPEEGGGGGVWGPRGAADLEPPSHGADAVPGPGASLGGGLAGLAPGPGLRRLPRGGPPRPPEPLRPFRGEGRQAGRQRRPEPRRRPGSAVGEGGPSEPHRTGPTLQTQRAVGRPGL